MPGPTRFRLAFLAVVLVGFGARLVAGRGIDLGFDGGLSVALGALPLAGALDFLAHDVHPPLYYLLLRVWLAFVGVSPFAVKYLSAICGTLTLAAVVAWARGLVGPRGALAAGAVFAVAPTALEISANVREYPLAIALIVVAAWSYTRWSKGRPWTFVVAVILAIWTSYLALGLLVASAVDALARPERRDRMPWIAGAAASILPWLAFALSQGLLRTFGSEGPRQAIAPAEPVLPQLWSMARTLTGGEFLAPTWVGPGLATLAVGMLIATALSRKRATKAPDGSAAAVFLGAGAVSSLVVALAVNDLWTHEALPARYLGPALPLLLVLLGGLVERVRGVASVLAVATLVGMSVVGSAAWLAHPVLPASYWDPTALTSFLDSSVAANDAIVFVSAEQAGYYESLSPRPRPWTLIPTGTDYLQGDAEAQAQDTLTPLRSRVGAFWLVLYHPSLGEGDAKIADWLSLNAYPATPRTLQDSDVAPYLTAAPVSEQHQVDAHLQGGVALVSGTWPTEVAPGGRLPVELDWLTSEPVARDFTVFVHLVDGGGKLWAQHDAPPENGRAPLTRWRAGQPVIDRHGLLLPANAPPGDYWLEVGLYDAKGRLPLEQGGDTIRLGPVHVGVGGQGSGVGWRISPPDPLSTG